MGANEKARLVLTALGVGVLSVAVGLVEPAGSRIAFGALVMGFLIWTVHTSVSRSAWGSQDATGPRKQRKNYALRQRVNAFLKNVRRLDAIARETAESQVPRATGDRALEELERQLHELVGQMRELAGRETAPFANGAVEVAPRVARLAS